MKTTAPRDDGFTLIELLMTVVMTAVIIGAISAALTTALRNHQSSADRLSESVDTQLVSAYLPGDVQNAGPAAGDVSTDPAHDAGCTGAAGTNVLALRWTDAETGAVYGVTYRTAAAAGEQRLLRISCGGATPGSTVVARELAASGGASADTSADPRIRFSMTSASGRTSTLSVMRRTYAGGSVVPPPLGCSVDVATVDPPTGQTLAGTLVPPTALTVTSSGACGTLTATYAPDGVNARTDTLGTGPGTTTTLLGGLTWSAGDRPITLRSNGGFLADVPFPVIDASPCAVTNVRTDPTSGVRTANPAPNRLAGAVTVTADFNTSCLGAYQLVVSTDGGTPATFDFDAGGAARSAVVPATASWSDGPHPLVVLQGTTPLATGSFTVAPQACHVGVPVLDRTSVKVGRDGGLNQPITITVTTTGVCDALSVRFTPALAPELKALSRNATWSSWTYTIGKDDHAWTTGKKTLEITSPVGLPLSPPRSVVLELS